MPDHTEGIAEGTTVTDDGLDPIHVAYGWPSASWETSRSHVMERGNRKSDAVSVRKSRRGDYGDTVEVKIGNQTAYLSNDAATELAQALLSAAHWDPEERFLRRASEILAERTASDVDHG